MAIATNALPNVQILNYSQVRKQIKSGDILLCSGTSLFSKLIQHATSSIWSHVAFVICMEGIDRIIVLESVESIGVRAVPLSSYIHNYNGTGKAYPGHLLIARHCDFSLANIYNLSKQAIDLLGYPYDSIEILRIAARICTGSFGNNKLSSSYNNEYICSEYVYECFKSVGITISYNTKGFITPADFARCELINPIALLMP